MALLVKLREFRDWIEQNPKKNVRFMKAYKKRMGSDISPAISEFQQKYNKAGSEETDTYELLMKTYACLIRPITLMETELRPSIGMGVFLERWMMTSAVETLLKECCDEVDQYLGELMKAFS